jgi:ABC-type nitrate/sulfonate/bicarbonate transport system permease component
MSRIDSCAASTLRQMLSQQTLRTPVGTSTRAIVLAFAAGLLLAGCAGCAMVRRRGAAGADPVNRWEGTGGENEPPVGGSILE